MSYQTLSHPSPLLVIMHDRYDVVVVMDFLFCKMLSFQSFELEYKQGREVYLVLGES